MPDILFIKTSSLGDVIHHMPAVTDARKALPDARFAWLVEEAFAPLACLHPAIEEVVPVAWRRWRKSFISPATLEEIAGSARAIRGRHYGTVIDTQGLLRTGVIARIALGKRHGYDRLSIREPLASMFYDIRHAVSRDLHAVERNRLLTGLALGYTPQGAPDYGLDRARLADPAAPLSSPYAVLLHATAQAQKEWPVANWIALGKTVAARGLGVVLPWGTEAERARSETIAAAISGSKPSSLPNSLPGSSPPVRVPDRAPLDQVARLIAGARYVVGVDTGLLHLAAALSVPSVAIFAGSKPHLTGPVGNGPLAVLGAQGRPPYVEEVVEALHALNC